MRYSDVHEVFHLNFKFTGTGVWALSHIVNLFFFFKFSLLPYIFGRINACYDAREPST